MLEPTPTSRIESMPGPSYKPANSSNSKISLVDAENEDDMSPEESTFLLIIEKYVMHISM